MQVLVNTPIWVWPLLAAVIWLGASQMRDREMTRVRALVLPIVMIGLSIIGTLGSFGARADAFIAWLATAALAMAANHLLFKWPRGVRPGTTDAALRVPGSAVPLVLILVIFSMRFVTGMTTAIDPARAADPMFVAMVTGVLGLCSGLFISRGLRLLGAPKTATEISA